MRQERLTMEIAKEYYKKAQDLPFDGGQDVGKRRELKVELMERCRITEIEAVNVLNGFHAASYVNKYDPEKKTKIDEKERNTRLFLLESLAQMEDQLHDHDMSEGDVG